jgi:hypothetical protein
MKGPSLAVRTLPRPRRRALAIAGAAVFAIVGTSWPVTTSGPHLAPTASDFTAAPTDDCLDVVNLTTGEGDWYCGDTVRVPRSSVVVAAIPPCASEDGSGPLPCRWDAASVGNGRGVSFTVVADEHASRLFRYDDGVTVVQPR